MRNISLFNRINKSHTPSPNFAFKGTSLTVSKNNASSERDSFEFSRIPLHKNSIAGNFFGVFSPVGIILRINNHADLISAMEYNWKLPPSTLRCKSDFKIGRTPEFSQKLVKHLDKYPARMTIHSKTFEKNGLHTIGLIYDKKTRILYCLDSLSNKNEKIAKYQQIVEAEAKKAMGTKVKTVIFSNKPQQSFSEYTCNNWAIANIGELRNALARGEEVDTVEKLNNILPDDINKILAGQYMRVAYFRKCQKNKENERI